ncbi:hypothetical protein Ahy_B09g098390 isoform A [Arachis hypogaea]|uniref:PROP1-like PPR domain-containing protein n=1 Tax=Arachis hypogaea TaxID=3818 RepID=A0A444XR70_ARAHY|nr:hypothetical protein Ahy_B09g098390 isoform A [Arachis hypogaea]
MFMKLQLLYTTNLCFHGPIFPNSNAVLVSPPEKAEKVPHRSNNGSKGTTFVKRYSPGRVNRETQLRKQGLEKNSNDGALEKRKIGDELSGSGGGNLKGHTKCSKKWASYGGCIPDILDALDTFRDVGEALSPWEERINNKERSIILKEQRRWDRALEIFKWFKENGHELNVIHYNIMIRTLGKALKWSRVEILWNEMNARGITATNSTYGTLIDVYSKERVAYSNASLSSHTYNALIDTYGKSGRLKEASETFVKMLKQGIAPTIVTFNTMIHICGNHGQLEEVSLLLRKMEELRCSPNTRTYNILVSIHAKHNDITGATKYFKRMKEACLEPDRVSYRTLLYAYSIRKMVHEAEELISDMDKRGLEIDEFTQSALTRMYIEAGMLERSMFWFWRFHLAGNMISECYAANIDAYGEHGHTLEAEEVFIRSQERKSPSVLEFNVMIKAYGIGKRYDKACELFDSMQRHGVVADTCSYSSLIHILVTADKPQIAKSYLKKMQEAGLVRNCVQYSAVISSFAKLGQLEMADDTYKEMIRYGVQPDVIIYGVLINAFVDVGRVKEAIAYADEMKRVRLPGNTVMYNCLIKLYTKVGNLKQAEETFKLLQSSEGGAAVWSCNCMIDLYAKQSMIDQAKGIFETLKRKRAANEFTFAMMLSLYKKLERLDEAIEIAMQMRKLKLLKDPKSYNSVLDLYIIAGRAKDTIDTFREMVRAAVKPDNCSFRSLGNLLVRYGVSRESVRKYEVLMKKDPSHGLQAWTSALSSVLEVDDDCGSDCDSE